ncbi:MAG: hypothetical protein ACREA4_03010 [Nitrososphaera sp.]
MAVTIESELAIRNAQLERELTALVEQISDSLIMAMDLSDQLEEMRVRNAELEKIIRDDGNAYFDSKAYRIGSAIVGAFRRLGLTLPYRLVQLSYRLVRRSYRLVRPLLERAIVARRRDASQD